MSRPRFALAPSVDIEDDDSSRPLYGSPCARDLEAARREFFALTMALWDLGENLFPPACICATRL